MSDVKDRRLLVRIAAGDQRALGQLYERHAALLAARLRHAGASKVEAEDALQETFLAVWRFAASYRGQGAVGAWLWGIAFRKLMDISRTAARARSREASEGEAGELWSREAEWAAVIDAREALDRLPVHLREALLAVAWEGLSVADAARRFGVAEGTIKSRVHRARRLLLEENA